MKKRSVGGGATLFMHQEEAICGREKSTGRGGKANGRWVGRSRNDIMGSPPLLGQRKGRARRPKRQDRRDQTKKLAPATTARQARREGVPLTGNHPTRLVIKGGRAVFKKKREKRNLQRAPLLGGELGEIPGGVGLSDGEPL